jgi:hypothetical protein
VPANEHSDSILKYLLILSAHALIVFLFCNSFSPVSSLSFKDSFLSFILPLTVLSELHVRTSRISPRRRPVISWLRTAWCQLDTLSHISFNFFHYSAVSRWIYSYRLAVLKYIILLGPISYLHPNKLTFRHIQPAYLTLRLLIPCRTEGEGAQPVVCACSFLSCSCSQLGLVPINK